MKTTINYATSMTLRIFSLGMVVTVDMGCKPLGEVLQFAEAIFNDQTFFHGDSIESIHVMDSNSGELIAECEPEKSFDDAYDDWVYNEDMGYDPYLGCYTDDC